MYLDAHYSETKRAHPWLDRDLHETANAIHALAKRAAGAHVAQAFVESGDRLVERLTVLNDTLETSIRVGRGVADEDDRAMKDRAVGRAIATCQANHPGLRPVEERRIAGVTAWAFLLRRGQQRVPRVPPSEYEPEASRTLSQAPEL